jgi:carnitine 3-dehydrogenase
MDVPDLTDDFVNEIGDQCETQADGLSTRDLESIRDDNLIAILQALKGNNWGAGKTLAAYEKQLRQAANDE